MKKLSITLAVTMFLAVSSFISCNSNSSKVQDAKENVEEKKNDVTIAKEQLARAEADSISQFEQFRSAMMQVIADNEKTIAELREKMKNENKVMKAKLEIKIEDLEKRNNDLRMKISEYKYDGKTEWQSFKKEFNHDMDELGHAVKDLTVRNTK
jgi:uncharacterized protein YpmS